MDKFNPKNESTEDLVQFIKDVGCSQPECATHGWAIKELERRSKPNLYLVT